MGIHIVRTRLTSIADDIETTAIDIRRVGSLSDVHKAINDLISLAAALIKVEEYWKDDDLGH